MANKLGIDRVPGSLPEPDSLETEALGLARIVAQYSLFPNAEVVAQFPGPVMPSIRANKALGPRGTTIALAGKSYVLDDNTIPRWSLLIAHGFGPSLPSGCRGWSFAHIWPEPQCPESYTCLANLAMVPEHLTSLTDKTSPVASYLRFHAWHRYDWKPPSREVPAKPSGFDTIEWRYFDATVDAKLRIEHFLKNSQNAWARQLVALIATGSLPESLPENN